MLAVTQNGLGGGRGYYWNRSPQHYLIRGLYAHRPYMYDPGTYRDPGAWELGDATKSFQCVQAGQGLRCGGTTPKARQLFRTLQKAINRAAYGLNLGEQAPENGELCYRTARLAFRVLVNTPVNPQTQYYLARPEMTDMDELVMMLATDPERAIRAFRSVPIIEGVSALGETTETEKRSNVGIAIAVSAALAITAISATYMLSRPREAV